MKDKMLEDGVAVTPLISLTYKDVFDIISTRNLGIVME